MNDTLSGMKQADHLTEGRVVSTFGYYKVGDGGGADYLITDSSAMEDGGSIINLQNGLQAHLLHRSNINYSMFGAVCDGVNDDGVQIKKAHDYANSSNLPIVNLSGDYWIKATYRITIQTNVQWGQSKFHIDESFNQNAVPRFQVVSSKDSNPIVLDMDSKKSLLSKLKPGVTLISELAPYNNCLVVVTDDTDRIGIRYGYEGHKGWARQEFFYVEEHGRIMGDIAWSFSDYTRLHVYPCDDNYLTVDGGSFYLSGNDPQQNYNEYVHNGFSISRSRTLIRNQWVGLEPGRTDVSLNARSGFYTFNQVYDVLLENVRLIPWEQNRGDESRNVRHGTYGIGGALVLNATFRNVTAEGSRVHWGVFGTNLFKNFRIENCRLNRVDVHFHCWNLYVRDSEIGYKGFTLTGGGDLIIENTKRYGNRFIDFRADYGAKWDGHIQIRNCRLISADGGEAAILHYAPADFDYKYPIGYGRTIKIADFTFDFIGIPEATKPCWVMKIAKFSQTSTGQRLFFPYHLECNNISVDGREKGVRIMEIRNPYGFDLRKRAVQTGKLFSSNGYMRFENMQLEKAVAPGSQTTLPQVNFLLDGANTNAYADEYALYPKIGFVHCRDFCGHIKADTVNVYFQQCVVNGVNTEGVTEGRLVFDNCDFQANAEEDAGDFVSLGEGLDTTFINCVVHAPIVAGAARPELVNRYGFVNINDSLRFNHIHTKLAKEIVDYYAHAGTQVEPEFLAMLMSHQDSAGIYMAKRKGTSAQRPEDYKFNSEMGFTYFDTELKQLIIWDGTKWIYSHNA